MIQYDDAWSYGENGKKANNNEPHHFKVLQPRGWVFRFYRGARSSVAWYKTCWWRNWNVSSSRTRASAATDASCSASGPASAVSARVPTAQLPNPPNRRSAQRRLRPQKWPSGVSTMAMGWDVPSVRMSPAILCRWYSPVGVEAPVSPDPLDRLVGRLFNRRQPAVTLMLNKMLNKIYLSSP